MSQALRTLIRLHRHRIDEKRRELGGIIAVVTDLERQSNALEDSILKEQEAAKSSPELAGTFYGNFAAHSILRREQFIAAIDEMEEKLAIAQDEMRLEYRDLKGYELTQEARDKAEELETLRSEQAILDEIGANVYNQQRLNGKITI